MIFKLFTSNFQEISLYYLGNCYRKIFFYIKIKHFMTFLQKHDILVVFFIFFKIKDVFTQS